MQNYCGNLWNPLQLWTITPDRDSTNEGTSVIDKFEAFITKLNRDFRADTCSMRNKRQLIKGIKY